MWANNTYRANPYPPYDMGKTKTNYCYGREKDKNKINDIAIPSRNFHSNT